MGTIIVGAGLAGLIAGCAFDDACLIDAAPKAMDTHQALLRFRTKAVSELTGIPFKEVKVRKAVYGEDGELRDTCSMRSLNQYALKVSGGVIERSISNLDPCVRYVAPPDFYEQLIKRHAHKIRWGQKFDSTYMSYREDQNFISTAPMPVNLAASGSTYSTDFKFDREPIRVIRATLNVPADVYQTVYFPDPETELFRASITGNVLIMETLAHGPVPEGLALDFILDEALHVFGLKRNHIGDLTFHDQNLGKIVDMPRGNREAVMHELTINHNIYSLGRFATWRNILLDDVVEDIGSIQAMIKATSYRRNLMLSK